MILLIAEHLKQKKEIKKIPKQKKKKTLSVWNKNKLPFYFG